MRRIAPDLGDAPFAPMPPNRHTGVAVTHLFTEGRTLGTLLLWVPFFMNLLILYFILSWLPSLLRQAGMPVSAGITAVLSFSIGGIVGTILQGPLMKGVGVFPAILGEFLASLGLVILASSDFRELPGDDDGHVRPRRDGAGRAGGHQRAVGDVLSDGDSLDRSGVGARHRPHRIDHRSDHRRAHAGGAVDAAADFHGWSGSGPVRGGGRARQRQAAGQRQPISARGRYARMNDYGRIERDLMVQLSLKHRPVAVTSMSDAPPGVEKFEGVQPSGCSFWKLAASGRSFYTVAADHYNCPIGSHTHNIPLPPERAHELTDTLGFMTGIGYIRVEEVPAIPRLAQTPGVVVYSPLSKTPVDPDVVLFWGPPAVSCCSRRPRTDQGWRRS